MTADERNQEARERARAAMRAAILEEAIRQQQEQNATSDDVSEVASCAGVG